MFFPCGSFLLCVVDEMFIEVPYSTKLPLPCGALSCAPGCGCWNNSVILTFGHSKTSHMFS